MWLHTLTIFVLCLLLHRSSDFVKNLHFHLTSWLDVQQVQIFDYPPPCTRLDVLERNPHILVLCLPLMSRPPHHYVYRSSAFIFQHTLRRIYSVQSSSCTAIISLSKKNCSVWHRRIFIICAFNYFSPPFSEPSSKYVVGKQQSLRIGLSLYYELIISSSTGSDVVLIWPQRRQNYT